MNVWPAEPAPEAAGPGGWCGKLVCVDGPSGAGKSSLVAALAHNGHIGGRDVFVTAEPTGDELGRLARAGVDRYRRYALACLIAADRHHHIDTTIAPALARGQLVITDRYVPSSYVLQAIDGVDTEFVVAINAPAPRADLTVLLRADPALLRERIAARGGIDRFHDSPGAADQELSLYEHARAVLIEAGWDVATVDTTELSTGQVLEAVRALIADRLTL